MIVVDASALIDLFLQTSPAATIAHILFAPGQTLHAPHIIDFEVAQVFRRYALAQEISSDRGQAVLSELAIFPMQRHAAGILLPRIWALRNNLTAYDAAYVALAEALGAELVTRDQNLAASSGHHARIVLI